MQALVDALATRPEVATPIVTITGMSGIGKTAMAVRSAHRLAARYPDGQLFLNLHGFTEGVEPVAPSEALERILRALGVPAADIPYEVDDRAALFRGIVAERRLLIVLDNASSEKQVTPMLTASPTSLLVITSRLSLAGLDNPIAFDLGLLAHADAVALLRRLLGDPGAAPPNIADEVVELCGRLPLAIRLAAARLRRRRSWTLADLADRLRDEQGRLQELEAGERSVAAAITLSVDQLQQEQRHLLLVLGLTPCQGFDLDTIAAASGLDRRRAARLVEQLVDAHLLDEPAPGRYQFHDLIRVFTASAAINDLPAAEHEAVAARLLQHYLSGVGAAMTTMAPYARHRRLLAAMEAGTFPPFADDAAAVAWLQAEHANLLAIVVWAGEHGLHDGVRTLSEGLFYYMETFACYADGVTLYSYSAEESRKHGDDIGEANALRAMGIFYKCLGCIPEAVAALDRCLNIFRSNAASLSEAAALITLAELLTAIGSLDVAAEHASRAHSIFRAGGDRMGEEYALRHIGTLRWMRGDREGAIAAAERARALCREAGNRIGEAEAQLRLGAISREQGRLAVAGDKLNHALELVVETGEREGECFVRTELGTLRSIEGDDDRANAHFQVALKLAHEIGSRAAEFAALHGLGEALLRSGDLDRALHHFQAALDLAKRIGLMRDFVRANDGVARTLHAMNRTSRAIEIWGQTLDEHGSIDIVEIAAIRARLDQLGVRVS